jgi:hypothetical protein
MQHSLSRSVFAQSNLPHSLVRESAGAKAKRFSFFHRRRQPRPATRRAHACACVIRSSVVATHAAKSPLLFALSLSLPELEFAGEACGNFSSLDKFVFYGHAKKMSENVAVGSGRGRLARVR